MTEPRPARAMIVVALCVAAACQGPSKLDGRPVAAECDPLWDLAPAGTEIGVVIAPRAMGVLFDALGALRELVKLPDFSGMAPELDMVDAALFGSGAAPETAGMAPTLGFALFVTADGVLGVLPVADRDKFVAAKRGTRGETDSIDGKPCKPLRGQYVCASKPDMFDKLGTGSLRGKPALAGGRGDVELYAPGLALFGGSGDAAVAAELGRGTLAVRARWTGMPTGGLGKLTGVVAPHVDATNASGFAAGNVTALLAGMPPVPLAAGVTMDQLAASFAGPIWLVAPTGSMDLQVHVPLKDPAPATAITSNCKDLGGLFDLTPDQPKDACRFRLQSSASYALALETWVDAAKELRLGGSRAAPSPGAPGALTDFGNELAAGEWTAVFWGRGTILNRSGVTPIDVPPPPDATAVLHAAALVDELGAGLEVDAQGISFRGIVRTVFADPDVSAQVIKVSGADIASGKATDVAKAVAAASPTSAFAADYNAGQGGMIVPEAVMGIAAAVIIPAFESVLGLGGGPGDPDDLPPMEADPQ